MNPFKFKPKDMVYFLSNNKVAYGWVNKIHYMAEESGDQLTYKIKATFHGKGFDGEDKREHEIFSTQEELVEYLSSQPAMQ